MSLKKILVAEDEPVARHLLAWMLQRQGYIVLQAVNGREALELLSAHPEVGLLITDIMMPEMDGRKLVRHLRGSKEFSALPIIMISGAVTVKEIADILDEGVSWFLPKPLVEKEVIELIERAFMYSESAVSSSPSHRKEKMPDRGKASGRKGAKRGKSGRN